MSQFGALLALLSILSPVARRDSLLTIVNRAGSPDPGVMVTSGGLILEWQAPAPLVRVSASGSAVVDLSGYAQSDWPGSPSLPMASAWIALPPGSDPVVEVLDRVESKIELPAPLSLAPSPQGVLLDQDGRVTGGQLVPSSQQAPFPEDVVVLEEAGVVRGQRLARLRFYPLRPSGEGLTLTEYVRVEVRFNAALQPAGQDVVSGDPLLAVIDRQVVNPGQLQPAFPGPGASPSPQVMPAVQEPRAAIEVAQVGITAITYEALKASGFPVDALNPHNLHLSRAGQEVAAEWGGDANSLFEPGERLLFFAEPRFSRWSTQDVYYLGEGSTAGARMGSRSALQGSPPPGAAWTELTFEKNILYTPDCYCAPIPAGRDGDRWTWDSLQVPSKKTAAYNFSLPAVDASRGGTLTVWLIGYTDLAAQPDHRVEFRLNGKLLGSREWDGKQAFEAKLDLAPGDLQAGQNTLTLTLPVDRVEGMWLDAFRVQFARGSAASGEALLFQGEATQHAYTIALQSTQNLRAYDVTSASQPIKLTGLNPQGNSVTLGDPADGKKHRYWVGSGVESPERIRLAAQLNTRDLPGAEYLALAPAAFISGLADLVQLRQGQGLQVAVEDVQAIYDTFGDGRPDPAAIRAFLAQAYQSWNPRPVYVLLVGDGTSDPKLYNPTSSQTFIPPYLAEVDPWAGESASDNRYAAVDGADILPDLLIGRLPANSLSEVKAMVGKIVSYEAQAEPQAWSSQGLFVTDNPDRAGDFPGMSDKVIQVPPTLPLLPRRLYFDPQHDLEQEFRDRLRKFWNEGAGLVMYTGHASILQWAVERFLVVEDIPGLKNGARLPVVLEMTCFTGSFHVPGFQTMDESLLRQPGGGAVAAWGSTGLGLMTGHRWLAQGFLAQLYGSSQATLGEAALAGKLLLSREGLFYEDLIDTFTLLGDPALQIVPTEYHHYLPVILQSP